MGKGQTGQSDKLRERRGLTNSTPKLIPYPKVFKHWSCFIACLLVITQASCHCERRKPSSQWPQDTVIVQELFPGMSDTASNWKTCLKINSHRVKQEYNNDLQQPHGKVKASQNYKFPNTKGREREGRAPKMRISISWGAAGVLITVVLAFIGLAFWLGGLARDVKRNNDGIKNLRQMNEERVSQEIEKLKRKVEKIERSGARKEGLSPVIISPEDAKAKDSRVRPDDSRTTKH